MTDQKILKNYIKSLLEKSIKAGKPDAEQLNEKVLNEIEKEVEKKFNESANPQSND